MRKQILFIAIAAITVFSSCKKDDDNTITTVTLSNTVMSGTWRITYYWDTDHEETSHFTGYSFTFAGGNVLTATKGGSVVTGTWQTGTDNSTVKLIIVFSGGGDFSELSEDWHVIERTDSKIRLQHISGGGGGTDYLTFEKN